MSDTLAAFVINYGRAKTAFTLTAERLTVATTGGPGPSLDIRVAGITQYFIETQPRPSFSPRGAVVKAAQAYAGKGSLLLSWVDDAGKKRSKRLVAHVDEPLFKTFMVALVRLRPDASLLALPQNQALRQMGFLTQKQRSLLAIPVIVVIAVGYVAARKWLGF
jgi:hypothetical protein